MKLLSIGEFSKITNIPVYTLRRMVDKGMFTSTITPAGTRYFGIKNIQEAKDMGILSEDFKLPKEYE